MLLSDRDLATAVARHQVMIDPFDPELLQPSSIDVRLGREFRVIEKYVEAINTRNPPSDLTRLITVDEGEPFRLHPGEFVLGSTVELVTLDAQHTAFLDGRSSLGRLGLIVHTTAGLIDAGFSGHITLELSNVAPLPLELWPGDRIGQLRVERLSSPAERPYSLRGRYNGQQGPTASLGVGR